MSINRTVPESGSVIATKALVELFLFSTYMATLAAEGTAAMVHSSSRKELVVLLLSGAGCLTEQVSVSAAKVSTLYRKRRIYVVAVKLIADGRVQLRAWR